jgi:integrative and conjugative element protein (TIGR02256 family)
MLYKHPFYDPIAQVLIESAVLELLQSHRQVSWNSTEAGGVLLGYRRDRHLHITEATLPAARDKRSRTAFWRRDPSHQAAASNGWTRTKETLDYVGEWHTHPESQPSPSNLDLLEWRKVCAATNEAMAFLILGMTGTWFGIGLGEDIRPVTAETPSAISNHAHDGHDTCA